jgi:Type IV secretion system pilin
VSLLKVTDCVLPEARCSIPCRIRSLVQVRGREGTRRVVARAIGLTALALLLFASPALAAGEEIGTALNRMIAWAQSILIPLSILTFIVGVVFLMIGGGTGYRHRGKTLMLAAILGMMLGFLAGPIVDLAASFVR